MSEGPSITAIIAGTTIGIIVAVNLGTCTASLQRTAKMQAESERKQKEFEAHMRQNEIDNAYRMGSFNEVLCNAPRLKPHTQDTTPCQKHYKLTGKKKD